MKKDILEDYARARRRGSPDWAGPHARSRGQEDAAVRRDIAGRVERAPRRGYRGAAHLRRQGACFIVLAAMTSCATSAARSQGDSGKSDCETQMLGNGLCRGAEDECGPCCVELRAGTLDEEGMCIEGDRFAACVASEVFERTLTGAAACFIRVSDGTRFVFPGDGFVGPDWKGWKRCDAATTSHAQTMPTCGED